MEKEKSESEVIADLSFTHRNLRHFRSVGAMRPATTSTRLTNAGPPVKAAHVPPLFPLGPPPKLVRDLYIDLDGECFSQPQFNDDLTSEDE
jgi:hypothetical protein